MTPEEIKRFRDEVAEPRMRKLLDNTVVPEGFCCIDNVEISFIDGRSWGIDSKIKASGLKYARGKVESYEYEEVDVNVEDFVKAHQDCVFLSNDSLKVCDELDNIELKTNVLNLRDVCVRFFEGFGCTKHLGFVSDSLEYLKMKELQRSSGLRAVNIMWDVDCDADGSFLPTEIDIPEGMIEMVEIIDYLSDVTGFCHEGFMVVDENGDRVEFDNDGLLDLKSNSLENKICEAKKENNAAMSGDEVLKNFREGDFGCR